MFGLDVEEPEHKMPSIFLILHLKFYIYKCKFQNVIFSFLRFKNMVNVKFDTKYKIAESKGKLV